MVYQCEARTSRSLLPFAICGASLDLFLPPLMGVGGAVMPCRSFALFQPPVQAQRGDERGGAWVCVFERENVNVVRDGLFAARIRRGGSTSST